MVYDTAKSGTYKEGHLGIEILWTKILEAPGLVVLAWMEKVRVSSISCEMNFKFKIMKVLLGDHDRLSDWDSMADADVNRMWQWVGSEVQESLNFSTLNCKNANTGEHEMKWVTTGETNHSMPEVSIGDSERRMGETKEDVALSQNSSVLPITKPVAKTLETNAVKGWNFPGPPPFAPPQYLPAAESATPIISEDKSPKQKIITPEPINSLCISLSLTMRNDTEKQTIERRWNITPTSKMADMNTPGATPEESPKPIAKMTPTEVIGDSTKVMPDEEHRLRGPDDPILRLFVSEPLLPPDTSQINYSSTKDDKNQTMGFLKHPNNVFRWMNDMRHCTLKHGVHGNILDDMTMILAKGSPYLTVEGLNKMSEEE
jgi:hypothetical protein